MTPTFPIEGSRSGGFTLIELMAVISILLLLSVLYFPLAASWAVHSKAVRCASNLRQAGILLQTYMADNGNKLDTFFGGSGADRLWSRLLVDNGYVTREDALKILRCPDGKTQYPPFNGTQWFWESYGLGMYRDELVWKTQAPNTRSIVLYPAQIAKPSDYLLLADSMSLGGYQTHRISNLYGSTAGLGMRHGNKANAFFLDGHMERLNEERAKELGMEGFIYFKE